jgi:hypothetical protein
MSELPPIAGDFLSLLAGRSLSPSRIQVTGQAPVETQATTVFAFHYGQGVLMAETGERLRERDRTTA